jgi:UDP-N-acetylglucosamine/UDP-N-acetylgalactosamine 4-epimerase
MKVLLTGGAGFIGSNLAEVLLADERVSHVHILDNLSTGSFQNIEHLLGDPKLKFTEGDIRDFDTCMSVMRGAQLVSHQAALGSVPRSIKDPITTNNVNITGTLNIFTAAKEQNVKRIVYAASSSTYGDHPGLPKIEDKIGDPLSPYAITKFVNELYAKVYADIYGMELIGLRYFNVFGPRQNPNGPYAAVIPLFAEALLNQKSPVINGDGSHSRDFTFVDNAVLANMLALFTSNSKAINQVYNIACGQKTTLLELFEWLRKHADTAIEPIFSSERQGDVRHSLADISKANTLLGYKPIITVQEGLQKTFAWYKSNY